MYRAGVRLLFFVLGCDRAAEIVYPHALPGVCLVAAFEDAVGQFNVLEIVFTFINKGLFSK